MFGMLSVLAELQRELIVANTNDGLAAARSRGQAGGRRPLRLTHHSGRSDRDKYRAKNNDIKRGLVHLVGSNHGL